MVLFGCCCYRRKINTTTIGHLVELLCHVLQTYQWLVTNSTSSSSPPRRGGGVGIVAGTVTVTMSTVADTAVITTKSTRPSFLLTHNVHSKVVVDNVTITFFRDQGVINVLPPTTSTTSTERIRMFVFLLELLVLLLLRH